MGGGGDLCPFRRSGKLFYDRFATGILPFTMISHATAFYILNVHLGTHVVLTHTKLQNRNGQGGHSRE